jgi:hypothetical protein
VAALGRTVKAADHWSLIPVMAVSCKLSIQPVQRALLQIRVERIGSDAGQLLM